jgi:hypothetical protein
MQLETSRAVGYLNPDLRKDLAGGLFGNQRVKLLAEVKSWVTGRVKMWGH